jgi:hypothetical protein
MYREMKAKSMNFCPPSAFLLGWSEPNFLRIMEEAAASKGVP